MRVWKIVSGILSVLLACFIVKQARVLEVLSAIVGEDSIAGSVGMLCGVLIFIGGIISIVTNNAKGRVASIFLVVLFGIAAACGFAFCRDYSDLAFYSIWAAVNAVIAFISALLKRDKQAVKYSLEQQIDKQENEQVFCMISDDVVYFPIDVNSPETDGPTKRLFSLLRRKEWKQAQDCCERILDQNYKNPIGYIGKLMVECHISSPSYLVRNMQALEDSTNFREAIQYADEELKTFLQTCNSKIVERNMEAEREKYYNDCLIELQRARRVQQYQNLILKFEGMGDYSDAKAKAEECRAGIAKCKESRKKLCGFVYIGVSIVVFALVFCIFIKPAISVAKAKKMQERGMYDEAYAEFQRLGREDLIEQNKRERAERLLETGEHDLAYILYSEVGDLEKIVQNKRKRALQYANSKEYEKAYSLWLEIGDEASVKESKYERALQYANSKEYEKAYSLWLEIGDETSINESKYERGMDLLTNQQYEEAYILLEEAGRKSIVDDSKIERAKAELENGNMSAAYDLLKSVISGESKTLMDSFIESYRKELFQNAEVGSMVLFGDYFTNMKNYRFPIEWIVLEKKGNKMLLLSKEVLNGGRFDQNRKMEELCWKDSDLRSWLNNSFLKSAFLVEERKQILTTKNSSQGFETKKVEMVEDKVFVLSYDEVKKYKNNLALNDIWKGIPTDYASNFVEGKECKWWLRTLDNKWYYVWTVEADGTLPEMSGKVDGARYDNIRVGVRPAMWITIP